MKRFVRIIGSALGCCYFLFNFSAPARAQNEGPAVLQWRSFLPYNRVNAIATDGNTFFCATGSGFFTYNRQDGSLDAYSKVNGMHDIGLSAVGYDPKTGQAVLAYENSNIDLFSTGQFINIPDIKSAQTGGDKSIHAIVASGGIAYLSSGIGLILLNLEKKEIKETVVFYDSSQTAAVNDAVIDNDHIYVATGVGLFRTLLTNSNFQNYATWEKLSDHHFKHLAMASGRLFLSAGDSIYQYQSNTIQFFKKAADTVVHLDAGNNGLWISSVSQANGGHGYLNDLNGNIIDSIPCRTPAQISQLADGSIWYADNSDLFYRDYFGLRKKVSATGSSPYFPDGPIVPASFDVSAYNGELWVAHGSYDLGWNGRSDRAMISHFRDGSWHNYNWLSDNYRVQDFIRVLYDPNTKNVYAASFFGGMVQFAPDGSWQVYNVGYLPEYLNNDSVCRVSGLALDDGGNLWMTNNGSQYELTVKTPDGNWYNSLSLNNGGAPPHSAADVVIDDYGQKWFIATSSNGAIVYDDKGTLSNTADDEYRILRTGEGNGNLPENKTTCIAKDKDGAIWIGTSNGIAIVNCPGEVISHECEASLKVVQQDQFAGHLFENQSINALAVDGANRKWVGTANGAWLLSEDGEKEIYRFTAANSPLPDNYIQRINIDPVTGDIYFSTAKGLVSFRSTATEGTSENEKPLLIYPNPVPSGYNGMIAVRGVADGADVRFTDISGQLVYRTTAFGGQAVWNGKDYTGHKVQSGVYLVFVVSKDGSQKTTGKVIIHK